MEFKTAWYYSGSVPSDVVDETLEALFVATNGDPKLWGGGRTEQYLKSWEANASCFVRMALESTEERVFTPLCDGFERLVSDEALLIRKVGTDLWWAPSLFDNNKSIHSDPRCVETVRRVDDNAWFVLVPAICDFKVEYELTEWDERYYVTWGLNKAALIDELMGFYKDNLSGARAEARTPSPALKALLESGLSVEDFEKKLREDTKKARGEEDDC